jgi:TonB family protein
LLGLILTAAAFAAETKPDLKPAPLQVDVGAPMLLSWVPPVFPKEAIEQKLEGRVQIRFVVDESGSVATARILRSTNNIFEPAALESLRRWKFSPAISDGHNVKECMDVTVPFRRRDTNNSETSSVPPAEVIMSLAESPRAPAVKVSVADPDYPDSLVSRHLPGVVIVDFTVSPEGKATNLRVLGATHADFVQPALAAVVRSTFRPASQGDLPVASPMEAEMEFAVINAGSKRVDILEANGVSLAKVEPNVIGTRPHLNVLVDPVYPYDLLLLGAEGDAVADFVIGVNGHVETVTIREAAQPAFGMALAAALDGWVFEPATDNEGKPIAVMASIRWHFNLGPDSPVAQSTMRLVERVRANTTADMGARGLDRRLNPRCQIQPLYPTGLLGAKPSGEATIQFIVDRDGRCRMARIVSATREEFGWAAATAVERWVFDPPAKGGKAADVRVSIPFKFRPPAE